MNCLSSKKPNNNESDLSEPTTTVKHEVLLSLPNCRVHLVGSGDAVEIANGDFSVVSLLEDGVAIATVIKVGDNLQWPLTRDEPVVKLDSCDYLFSLPMRGSEPLNYGVSFLGNSGTIGIDHLGQLDGFLKENSCFSCSDSSAKMMGVNWKDYAPKVDDYNNFLAKAIAQGTGQVVKGIFMCSNAYASQVQKAGQNTLGTQSGGGSVGGRSEETSKTGNGNGAVNENLKRVRNLTKTTENISKTMLDGVGIVTGSAATPVMQSGPGKKLLSTVPGQVLLASLDAIDRVVEAAEVAERQAVTATTAAACKAVSDRFGENAGEATEDVIAITGHTAHTALNIYKIKKAINPAASKV